MCLRFTIHKIRLIRFISLLYIQGDTPTNECFSPIVFSKALNGVRLTNSTMAIFFDSIYFR